MRGRSRKTSLAIAIIAAFAGWTDIALANDSTAVLRSDGLELVSNPWVKIEQEDLRIEAKQIAVRYVFRNTSEEDHTLLVAFPLPDLDGNELADAGIIVAKEDSHNFVDFNVWADGVQITPKIELRAYAAGLDVTDDLKREGISLTPYRADQTAFRKLSPEQLRDFEERGIVRAVSADDIQATWTLKTKFYWRQAFPKDKPVVIEHKYVPVVGLGFYGTDSLKEDPWLRTDYCLSGDVERQTRDVLRRLTRPEGERYMHRRIIEYILTTANNWHDSIGTFRLTIDTNDTSRFASSCFKGLRKVSPTRYEFTASDFKPSGELKVLFIEPMPE